MALTGLDPARPGADTTVVRITMPVDEARDLLEDLEAIASEASLPAALRRLRAVLEELLAPKAAV